MTKEKISTNLRKWLSIIIAIIMYYIIHEGAHIVVALLYGVLEKVKFLGLGVQIVAEIENLSHFQTAIFCIIGSVSTLVVAYILVSLTNIIVKSKSKVFKAICYYATLALLLLDPLYLSVIYKFVGGGDMNGILLLGIPELVIQIIFGSIAVMNIFLIIKKVYPKYKEGFNK